MLLAEDLLLLLTDDDTGKLTEERTAALVSLLHALKVAHKVMDPGSVGLSKKELNANAKRIAEGDWAAKAVREAIDGTNTAIIIAATSSAEKGVGG